MAITRTLDHQLRDLLDDRRSFSEELDELASFYEDPSDGATSAFDDRRSNDEARDGGSEEVDRATGL